MNKTSTNNEATFVRVMHHQAKAGIKQTNVSLAFNAIGGVATLAGAGLAIATGNPILSTCFLVCSILHAQAAYAAYLLKKDTQSDAPQHAAAVANIPHDLPAAPLTERQKLLVGFQSRKFLHQDFLDRGVFMFDCITLASALPASPPSLRLAAGAVAAWAAVTALSKLINAKGNATRLGDEAAQTHLKTQPSASAAQLG